MGKTLVPETVDVASLLDEYEPFRKEIIINVRPMDLSQVFLRNRTVTDQFQNPMPMQF